jgi:hypothetical protein
MPNFDLVVGYGLAVADWNDPRALVEGAPNGPPSRLNPRAGILEKRLLATVGVECELRAQVGGADAPLDSELGGNLFYAATVEAPHPWQLPFSSPTGQSSIQQFTPNLPGHYLIYIRRMGGGQVMVHFDTVEGR